jgi:hypothetical protein
MDLPTLESDIEVLRISRLHPEAQRDIFDRAEEGEWTIYSMYGEPVVRWEDILGYTPYGSEPSKWER